MVSETGGWWCCCPEGCWYFYDNFCEEWHPDGEVMPYWVPEPDDFGYWAVIQNNCPTSGLLVEVGTPGAIVRTSVCVPQGTNNTENILCSDCINVPGYCSRWMRAICTIIPDNRQYGDSYSLLLDYKDTANYLEYRKTLPDSAEGLVLDQIYSVVESAETLLATCESPFTGLEGYIQLEACVRKGVMYANEGTEYTVVANIPSITCNDEGPCGLHAGFKHSCSHAVAITDWQLDQIDVDNKQDCFPCGVCDCLESLEEPSYPMPSHLSLTIAVPGTALDCFGLDGVSISLLTEDCSPQTWVGQILNGPSCLGPRAGDLTPTMAFTAVLACPDGVGNPTYGPVGRILTLSGATPNGPVEGYAPECCPLLDTFGGAFYSTSESTCNPLSWVFEFSGEVMFSDSYVQNTCPSLMDCCEFRNDGELGPRWVCFIVLTMIVTES
ncbi:hypothetical protein M0R72_21255 [Candidatus Pacearchaeota archaeon]|jgi:hypothetical protein|nr:hypothetical protein [Candidatus Pacearchaeota archaeon]